MQSIFLTLVCAPNTHCVFDSFAVAKLSKIYKFLIPAKTYGFCGRGNKFPQA